MVWKCSCNLDIEVIPFSTNLKSAWIDWVKDGIVPNVVELEEEYNKQGIKLTEKVRLKLAGTYKVSFSPSTFAKRHLNK